MPIQAEVTDERLKFLPTGQEWISTSTYSSSECLSEERQQMSTIVRLFEKQSCYIATTGLNTSKRPLSRVVRRFWKGMLNNRSRRENDSVPALYQLEKCVMLLPAANC